MKIIILQLARLGDIIQTLPAVQALKAKHPNSEITLVVRETFADAARICPHVDKIVELPTRAILGPVTQDASRKNQSLAQLIHWFSKELAQTEYDLLLNLSFSPASAYLSNLIRAKERRGVTASGSRAYAIADAWSQYFFSQVLEHNLNIIHLNDLFMRIAGVEKGHWPLDLLTPPDVPVTPTTRVRIGVQVTASTTDKTLEPRLWAHLCNIILGSFPNSELVFFGAASDLPVIQNVLAAMREESAELGHERTTILAGKLRFHENIPWVRSCEWVISPDTAMVHLASACCTKVIELAVGRVRPDETGPFGEGHHVIFPAQAGPSEFAIEVARVVGGEKARPVVAEAITKFTRMANGTVRNELLPHNFTQSEASGFFMQAYYLLAEFRCGGRQDDVAIPKLGDTAQAGELDRVVAAYDALCSVKRASDFGQHYCLKMLENIEDQSMLTELMAKLSEIEEMLDRLQKSVSLVKPLIDTWRVAKDVSVPPQVPGQSGVEAIIAVTEGSYRELGQNVEIIQQLLQSAVAAAQKKTAGAERAPVLRELSHESSHEITKERL